MECKQIPILTSLSEQDIREFQLVYYQETKIPLTMAQAEAEGLSLIRFLLTFINHDLRNGNEIFGEEKNML